jgi:hypothetical protein
VNNSQTVATSRVNQANTDQGDGFWRPRVGRPVDMPVVELPLHMARSAANGLCKWRLGYVCLVDDSGLEYRSGRDGI